MYKRQILDACDDPRVPVKADELGADIAVSLYRGKAAVEYSAIAPYLIRVTPETLAWIKANLWAEPWGIFAVADASLSTLRKHFRQFLLVESPEGQCLYFRYYDPRVLPQFLATSTTDQVEPFFGPINRFACLVEGKLTAITLTKPSNTFPIG